jgi:uncharacterized membrane protein
MRAALLLVFFLLALQTNALAQTYYADLSINLGQDGTATISGLTNHPQLESKTTSDLTSKKGSVWTFNLSLPKEDEFSDYVYEIVLPTGAAVNYVKSSGSFRLAGRGDQIIVYGSGENESLSVLIQYQIGATQSKTTPVEYYYIGAILLISLGGLIFFFYLGRKKHLSSKEKPEFETSPNEEVDESILSDRQKDILEVLRKAGAPVNQTVICDKLNLPKSSVSRNIDSLEGLGYITKTRNGMSTMIILKKK